jgi:hypothetical protein
MAKETAPEKESKDKPAATPPTTNEIPTDNGELSTVYTNFCRVVMTPEELVMDFGLNPTLAANPTEPVALTHRVVMSFFTAKRLLNALASVVTQHEASYGALELDVQKRVRPR